MQLIKFKFINNRVIVLAEEFSLSVAYDQESLTFAQHKQNISKKMKQKNMK